MKLCLDLCSGLGGFSQAFREHEDWEVITVDINKKFKPSMVLDLIDAVEYPDRHADFWQLKPDVILASPPCERFSLAANSFPRQGIYTGMRVAGAVLEIIARMLPKGWIIENPKGRLRWFLGVPNIKVRLSQFGYRTVKPTDFWTNIDIGLLKSTPVYNPEGVSFAQVRQSHIRASMPYGLSKKVLESFEAMESKE